MTKIEGLTKITAIIPTFNEESNIEKALESVQFADEIIVIDSFSTDGTIDIVATGKLGEIAKEAALNMMAKHINFFINTEPNEATITLLMSSKLRL